MKQYNANDIKLLFTESFPFDAPDYENEEEEEKATIELRTKGKRELTRLREKSKKDENKMHKVVTKEYELFEATVKEYADEIDDAEMASEIDSLVDDATLELNSVNNKNWMTSFEDV